MKKSKNEELINLPWLWYPLFPIFGEIGRPLASYPDSDEICGIFGVNDDDWLCGTPVVLPLELRNGSGAPPPAPHVIK